MYIQVRVPSCCMALGGNSLEGSEHYLNGVQQPMEVQLFHWNTKYMDYTTAAMNSDGLAAVSFFYEVSSEDNLAISGQIKVLERLVEVLEQLFGGFEKRQFVTEILLYDTFPTSSLSQLLPTGGLDVSDNYFYYSGSLTLPNTTSTFTPLPATGRAFTSTDQQTNRQSVSAEDCSESVQWIVYEKKIAISEAQLSVYRRFLSAVNLCSHNFRPLHPLNPEPLTALTVAVGRKFN